MNISQKNLDSLSFSKHIPLLFMIMTFSAILPLYFENVKQISGIVFVSILLFLSIVAYRTPLFKVNRVEKLWLYVAMSYALILILSYLLRTPYTADGEWRNSAPLFVLLVSAWFFLSIRFNQQKELIRYVAVSAVFCGVALLITELSITESLANYRFGLVYDDAGRGLAAIGFILPMTTGLLFVLWLKERTYFYLALLLTAFLLSGMNGSRTAFSILLMMIAFGMAYVFIWGKMFSNKAKWLVVALLAGLVFSSGWLARSKILAVGTDVASMQSGNYYTSLGLRYAMFDIGLQALKGQWLLGVGPSQYKNHISSVAEETDYSERVKKFASGASQIHNQYIMALLLAGVAGVVALLFFLTYPIKVFLSYFNRYKDPAALISVGLLVGIMFIMFFGAVLTYTYTTIFYMLAVIALVGWFGSVKEASN